jgi:hypothetical protein
MVKHTEMLLSRLLGAKGSQWALEVGLAGKEVYSFSLHSGLIFFVCVYYSHDILFIYWA